MFCVSSVEILAQHPRDNQPVRDATLPAAPDLVCEWIEAKRADAPDWLGLSELSDRDREQRVARLKDIFLRKMKEENGMKIFDYYSGNYLKADDLDGREMTVEIVDVKVKQIGDNGDTKAVVFFKNHAQGPWR